MPSVARVIATFTIALAVFLSLLGVVLLLAGPLAAGAWFGLFACGAAWRHRGQRAGDS